MEQGRPWLLDSVASTNLASIAITHLNQYSLPKSREASVSLLCLSVEWLQQLIENCSLDRSPIRGSRSDRVSVFRFRRLFAVIGSCLLLAGFVVGLFGRLRSA